MAILATIFGTLGRYTGKLLTAALGWASTLLFGRVPQDKQILLVLMTFGSVLWVVLVVGVIFPEVGTFLLAFAPIPAFLDENLIRLAMLVAALIVPLLIGLAAIMILPSGKRPAGLEAIKSLLRGYPLAFVLALVLVFLGLVAVVRKSRALIKRWNDAHVPIVVREGGYDRMVDDLEHALDESGLAMQRADAPKVMVMPARLLAAVAGGGVRSLVPDRLVQLRGRELEVQLYPSDIAIAGRDTLVNRSRAVIASRLVATSAFLTTSAEAQAVEERLQRLTERHLFDDFARRDLATIDERLMAIEIPYEEWEVLYRMRLQVERDLLTGRTPGATPDQPAGSADRPTMPAGRPAAVESVAAAGLIAMLVLDVVLAIRDRGGR